jgi:uncharacterized protein YndB with AHSA1/START domain
MGRAQAHPDALIPVIAGVLQRPIGGAPGVCLIGNGLPDAKDLPDAKERPVMTGPFVVEVSAHVAAAPEDVFSYFTDPARYVQWMGREAKLDPVPGGVYRVRMSDGFEAAGAFLSVDPPHQLAFTWGFADDEAAQRTKGGEATSGDAMPAGSTRVTVTLDAEDGGTRLTLRHDRLPNAELRDAHQVAWETYLPRLVIRVAGGDPGPDPHS